MPFSSHVNFCRGITVAGKPGVLNMSSHTVAPAADTTCSPSVALTMTLTCSLGISPRTSTTSPRAFTTPSRVPPTISGVIDFGITAPRISSEVARSSSGFHSCFIVFPFFMMMSFVNLFSLLRSYENAAVNSPENTAARVCCFLTGSAGIISQFGGIIIIGCSSSPASVFSLTSVAGHIPSAP